MFNLEKCLALVSLVAVLAASGLAQTSTWSLDYRFRPGDRVAFVPDVNADGVPDLLVGDRRAAMGEVRLVSGRDFRPIRSWQGSVAGSGFGDALLVGDVNGDKVVDYIVGAPLENGGRGSVSAIDGKTNRFLWTISGSTPASRFGAALCLADSYPIFADGKPDLWIGAPDHSTLAHPQAGRIELYDLQAARPARLRIFEGSAPQQRFGRRIVNLGDVDNVPGDDIAVNAFAAPSSITLCSGGFTLMISGSFLTTQYVSDSRNSRTCFGTGLLATDLTGDGRNEVLVGSGRMNVAGAAFLFEYDRQNSTWRQIHRFQAQVYAPNFGFTFCRTGDLDMDGTDDLAIAGAGGVELWSGKSWKPLTQFPAAIRAGAVGDSELHCNGDFDGDGFPDILTTDSSGQGLTQSLGSIDVHSPRSYPFTLSQNYISIARGGSIDMDIDVGAQYAGQVYMVLGSISGSAPGTLLAPGVRLPLNYDPFMSTMAMAQNVVPFTNTLGFLDRAGKAKARWTAVGGLGPFAPLYMEYATLVLGLPARQSFDAATNARHLVMVR